jgi:hypothetical protein
VTFEKDREQLNLQENDQEVLLCHGRIQDENPVYLPNTSTFTEKLVQEAHSPRGSRINNDTDSKEVLGTQVEKFG